jgi:hypothetical protein
MPSASTTPVSAALTQQRQVDLLSGNVYRFFDTFTNNTGATITTTLNVLGKLGSDGDELISFNSGGLIVSCEDDWSGACGGGDPVLALVSGNNGLGKASITPDRYNVSFSITLQAGQSLSLLNFAFLASELDGPTAADQLLAKATGQALLNAPRLDGGPDRQHRQLQHHPGARGIELGHADGRPGRDGRVARPLSPHSCGGGGDLPPREAAHRRGRSAALQSLARAAAGRTRGA